MYEYIEKALSLLSVISIDDIKKFLNSDNGETLEIWGDYDAFFNSQDNPQSELNTFIWICENNVNDLKYEDYKAIGINIYIIGKIGYFRFIWQYLKFVFSFVCERTDLNIFTRFYLSFVKAYHKIKRTKFQIEIDKFTNSQINCSKRIFELFKLNKIDRLYLYKFNRKGTA